ncbi:MAG: FtsX-like permease family protein [Candidatus Heimdallarchaeota archaeon]|nr:MAG: FtsX-like permease family protein [Candidatus Heimdallarchaeota archaeon]
MLEPLLKAVRNREIISRFLALKGEIIEVVLTRRVRASLKVQKIEIQKKIHTRSVKLRQWSLKKAIVETVRASREQTKLMFGLAIRNATRSKYRSFLLIFGILLTVALETGIVISVDTLYDDFIFDHRNQNFTDITVNPKEWITLDELQSLAKSVQRVPGVSKASPVYYILANAFLDVEVSDKVLVYGINPKSHPDFTHLKVIEGEREVSGYTVMISEKLQDAVNAEIGTPIPISDYPNLNISEITVGGIISDEPYFGNKLLHSFILVDIEVLYNIIPKDQRNLVLSYEIDVSVDNLIKIKQAKENIQDLVGFSSIVIIEKAITEIEAQGILAYQTAMNLVILASFLVEFLFITNVLAIAIKDRSKEFGILRAVGINSGQLIILIALEILFYAIIGSIFGILGGIGFSTFLIGIIDSFYVGVEIQVISIHPSSLTAAFLSGIIVSLISGLYPIFLALNIPVVQNIHSKMRTAKSTDILSNWRYSVVSGILLSITGFFLQFFVGPTRFLDFSILSVHFLVVILIFVGTVLLEIGILVFLPKIGMKLLFYFGIITRIISMRNIAREFQKSLFTILTTALALAFIIVTGLTSAAVIASVPDYFESQWGNIDLFAETRDTFPLATNFTQELDRRHDIKKSSYIQEARTEIEGRNGYVFGVDPSKYSYFAEHVVETRFEGVDTYNLLNTTTEQIFNTTSGELIKTINITHGLISHRLYQRLQPQIPLGSNITISTSTNTTANITLSAIIKGNVFLNNGEYLYITSERFQEFFSSELAKWFVCDVQGEAEYAQVSLENAYPELKEVIAITFYKELIEDSLVFQTAIFQVLFVQSLILAAMAQFVCILISTLRMEREMGIMRSLGLHKRSIFGIFMSESTALGLSAVIIGLIDGLLGAILLAWYISRSIPVSIQFPLDRVILWMIFSFMVTLVSTILPSYRSSQKNIIATISGRPMAKIYIEKPFKPFSSFYSPPLPPHLDREYMDLSDQTSLWSFLRERKVQIQTSFLILLAIVTLNYIFEVDMVIRGLIPADIIWRELLNGLLGLLNPEEEIIFIYDTTFLQINPLLFFVGLATVGPISYYISNDAMPNNMIKNVIRSVILGVVSIIICFYLFVLLLFLFFFFISSLISTGVNYELALIANLILMLVLLVFVFLIGTLLFQRIWAFLILQGSNPNLGLRDQIMWTRKSAPSGQFGFILLVFLHISLQALFFLNTIPLEDEFHRPPRSVSSDPILFLVLSGFEVGFFLLLIVYQLVQFRKQRNLFSTVFH